MKIEFNAPKGCSEFQDVIANMMFGELSKDELRAVEEHLGNGCGSCKRAVEDQLKAATALASIQPVAPSRSLRDRLMDKVRKPNAESAFASPLQGVLVAFPKYLEWKPSGIPGVTHKMLSRDSETGAYSAIVRLEAGTQYPPHKHAGDEQIIMLSGVLNAAGFTLRAGDYCFAKAGSVHPQLTAVEDAEFFVVANEKDEILHV